MLNERICKKREELNNSIRDQQNYEIIYKLSVELDDLIADYYKKDAKCEKNKEQDKILI